MSGPSRIRHRTSALAAITVLASAVAAQAQQPPSRIGNIMNGHDYQPTQGEVLGRERSAGIAPDPQQQNRTTDEVEQLDRQLLNTEKHDPALHPQGAQAGQAGGQ